MTELEIREIMNAVMREMRRQRLVEVEVSARHVHLTGQDLETLFGKGAKLTPKKSLSQPGQFLSEERVTLVGGKSRKEGVAVLGPVRKYTQVELAKSDCLSLGVKAPLRESGDVADSGPIEIVGPCGKIQVSQGAIIAHNHIHLRPETAAAMGLTDKQRVSVSVRSERPVVFLDVIVRVSTLAADRMHIDVDEANAAGISGMTFGTILTGGVKEQDNHREEKRPAVKKLLTEQYFRDQQCQDVTEIRVGKKTIVTDLAGEYIKKHNIKLIRCD